MTSTRELLGSPLADADPAKVRTLGRSLRQTAESAEAIRTSLRQVDDGLGWEGAASRAFANEIDGDLPRDLEKIRDSCAVAGDATTAFAGALDAVRSTVEGQTHKIRAAEGATANADARFTSANSELQRLEASSFLVDPTEYARQEPYRRRLQTARDRAAVDRTNAKADRDAAQRVVDAAKDAFRAAERRCQSELERASDLGIKNSLKSWAGRRTPLGAVVDALAQVAKVLVNGTLGVLYNLGKGIITHDWGPFSKSLDDLGTIATVVAVGAAIAVAVVGTGGTILVVATGVGAVAAGGKLATDGLRRRAGDQRVTDGQLVGGAVAFGLSLVPGGRVLKPAATAVKHQVRAGGAFVRGAGRDAVDGQLGRARAAYDTATDRLRNGWRADLTAPWRDPIGRTTAGSEMLRDFLLPKAVESGVDRDGTRPPTCTPTPFTTTPNAEIRHRGTFAPAVPGTSPYPSVPDLFFLERPAGAGVPAPVPAAPFGGISTPTPSRPAFQ